MPFLQLFIIRIFQYFHILFFQLRCICIPSKKRVPVRKVKRYLHSFLFFHIWSHFPVKSQDGVSVQGLPGNGLPAEDMLTILPGGISRPWQSRSKNGWTRTLPHRLHIRYFRIFSIWMRNIYPPCSKQNIISLPADMWANSAWTWPKISCRTIRSSEWKMLLNWLGLPIISIFQPCI